MSTEFRPLVLVAEDSRTQAAMLRTLLQRGGYEVEIAYDGRAALAVARVCKPALVISDIVMPVMNGFEMCHEMKHDSVLCDIPVLLLTSLGDPIDIVRGLQAGADYYVTKPYDPQYVVTTVGEIIRQWSNEEEFSREPREELHFELAGELHRVNAGRRQMLNLLLSTYTNAVLQNRTLTNTQHELRTLNAQLVGQRQQIEAQQRELREINSLLHTQATRDSLTGLRNRRSFVERLAEEVERVHRHRTPFSLIMLDVDRFKQFNDSFGHPAGDEVLRRIAHLMEEGARVSDFVARYGGEEFAILLSNTAEDTARVAGERVREAIEKGQWPQRAMTASIGVATMDYSESTGISTHGTIEAEATTLIKLADAALYASKANGRNRVTHAADLKTLAE